MMETLRCLRTNHDDERFNDDGLETVSGKEQDLVEEKCEEKYFKFFIKRGTNGQRSVETLSTELVLNRDRHIEYLLKGLRSLSSSHDSLDASRPWLCYWIVHSLELLQFPVPLDLVSGIAAFLAKCQQPSGGFAGGPDQEAHLAPTYAAICTLCILGTEEAYSVISRPLLQRFLRAMHQPDGSFIMHAGGEVDIRGAYCAASVARLTHLPTDDSMFDNTAQWIVSCQTYEGGFSGVPGMEAHGGYSYCGLAALMLLGHDRLCDIEALLRWTVNRQMRYEGGFQGRANKLVDGCYSFWIGAIFPLVHMLLSKQADCCLSAEHWLFNQTALQEYLLICCQDDHGGMVDKPEKRRDFYHTCYCLSGLSVAQHFAGGKISQPCIVGSPNNELLPTHPLFNIGVDAAANCVQHFTLLGTTDVENPTAANL